MVTSCFALLLAAGHLHQESQTLRDPQFDQALYKGYADLYNVNVAYESAAERVLTTTTVPKTLSTRIESAGKSLAILKSIRSGKVERDDLRKKLVYCLESFISIDNLLVEAFNISQSEKQWTSEAKNRVNQAQAIYKEKLKENPLASFFVFLNARDNWDFRSRCPEELETFLNIVKSQAGFDIGVVNYTDVDSRILTVVVHKGLAAKLGFHSGDVLTKIENKDIESLEEFKMELKAMKGKSVKVGLLRDDKPLTLSVDIPEDLTVKKGD